MKAEKGSKLTVWESKGEYYFEYVEGKKLVKNGYVLMVEIRRLLREVGELEKKQLTVLKQARDLERLMREAE